jgi:hypothetical protein
MKCDTVWMRASLSEEYDASIFRIEKYHENGGSRFFRNGGNYLYTKLHGVTSQENII